MTASWVVRPDINNENIFIKEDIQTWAQNKIKTTLKLDLFLYK